MAPVPAWGTESAHPSKEPALPDTHIQHVGLEQVRSEIEPRLTKLEPDETSLVAQAIIEECRRTGFDPLFVIAVIQVESRFDVEAVSSEGARGLMQLLPRTFRLVSDAKRMFDPVENVRAGIRYLEKLRQSGFKRPESVALAYNVGPGKAAGVLVRGEEAPAEGKAYVPKVLGEYHRLLQGHGYRPEDARRLFLLATVKN
jgi:soluble lytic murein transglycosylase-like protein